jgi:hypothetical protein
MEWEMVLVSVLETMSSGEGDRVKEASDREFKTGRTAGSNPAFTMFLFNCGVPK